MVGRESGVSCCWPRLRLRRRRTHTRDEATAVSRDTSAAVRLNESPSGGALCQTSDVHAFLAASRTASSHNTEGGPAGDNTSTSTLGHQSATALPTPAAPSQRSHTIVSLPALLLHPSTGVSQFRQRPERDSKTPPHRSFVTPPPPVTHSHSNDCAISRVQPVHEVDERPETSERAHISPPPSALMQPVNVLPAYSAFPSSHPQPLASSSPTSMYVTDRRIPLPLGCGAELREPQVKEDVSIVRAESPTCINLMSLPRRSHGIHTFVMMPLDFGQDHGWLSHNDALHGVLGSLRHAGVRGVMVDVWWGLCEREPQSYDFGKYLWLSDACRHHGLKLQAVMAFHSCGGNVGDNVNVPLPAWASTAADKHEAWYLERAQKHGADRNGINREYISHGADHCVFLPGMDGLRTPIEAYTHFVEAFCRTMSDKGFAGGTVTEIQVGMGPCGEIRYPSYQLRDGKWKFPGIGELQCFDKYLLASLAAAAKRDGHPVEWGVPPKDTGYYNGRIQDAPFYNGEHRTPRGRFFLRWYSEALVQHCEDVLSSVTGAARAVNIDVACKIAGIHWGYLASVRVPECNAGYLVNDEYCFYDEAAAVLRKYGAVLDFTCLEMASEHQPAEAKAAPRQLVHDVFEAAARAGVPVAGENALECYDRDSFNRVVQAFRWSRADAHGFTLLRLTHTLLEHDNHHNLRRLAEKLRHVNNN